jgi:glutaredoxin-related protein
MARRHGRNGRIYLSITSGGTAESIAYLRSWSIDFASDKVDVTALGDSFKTYVAGLPDAQGQFAGFYDDATAQMYTAATDGVARKFYLYPDTTNNPNQYWFGTAFFDFSTSGAADAALEMSGSFAAATAIAKVG